MKNIKTIVLDVDGTLLNRKKKISKLTKEALIKVQENGIKVILASGRPTQGMVSIAKELKMNKYFGVLVSYNGAYAVDCTTNEVLYSQTIKNTIVKELLEYLKKFDVIPMIANDEYLYVNDVFGGMIDTVNILNDDGKLMNILKYETRGGGGYKDYLLCEIKDLAKFVNFPLYKVLVAANPNYLQENYKKIMEPFNKRLNCMFSAPFYFEFTDLGVDKSSTLRKIFNEKDIETENLMAFGDGHNDITMIKLAGVGIAMGNSEVELLKVADEITATNEKDGIALKLYEYFPNVFE